MSGSESPPQWLREAFLTQSQQLQNLVAQQEATAAQQTATITELAGRIASMEAMSHTTTRTEAPTPISTAVLREDNVKRPKPRLPHPDKFDGTNPSAYPQFEGTLRAKLAFDAAAIGGSEEQVWYTFGRLSGSAAVQLYPWMEAAQIRGVFTVESLFEQMRATFQDPRRKQKALADLNRMKQGSQPLNDFLAKFDQAILEAQAWGWDDETKKAALKAALSTKLILAMVGIPENPTYEGYRSQLRMTNDQLEEAAELTARNQAWKKRKAGFADSSQQRAGDSSRPSQPSSEDRMDWQPTVTATVARTRDPQWGTPAEVAKRREEGLCLRCGLEGHIARGCRAKLAQPQERRTQVKATRSKKKNEVVTIGPEEEGSSAPEDSGKE